LTFVSDEVTGGRNAGTAFALRRNDGTLLGHYATVGQAQRAFARVMGRMKILWERADLPGKIVHYRAVS